MTDQDAESTPPRKRSKNADATAEDPSMSTFLLEELYPDTTMLLSATSVATGNNAATLVAFDTNALLLPYNIGSQDLSALTKVFKELADADRLFVPARVIREFIKNRDGKLADMLKALNNKKSRVASPERKISPLLEGVEGYDDLLKAADDMLSAHKRYDSAHSGLVATIKSWRGNDPVTLVYNEVFQGRIIEPDDTNEQLAVEWERRRRLKIPPGYKDANKEDTGIGDFLIWKTLVKLGAQHKKDLIFITGEEKADWFVRSDNERVYPRPELIDEYRRITGGKNIRLSTLYELLKEMNVSEQVVSEVKSIEQRANNAIATASIQFPSLGASGRMQELRPLEAAFDYSTYDGRITLTQRDLSVSIKFSKGSDRSIHLYRDMSTTRIARVRVAAPGIPLNIDDLDTSSRSYTVEVGEVFMAQTSGGEVLVGRIVSIKDDSRGDDHDEVRFTYYIFRPEETATAP